MEVPADIKGFMVFCGDVKEVGDFTLGVADLNPLGSGEECPDL